MDRIVRRPVHSMPLIGHITLEQSRVVVGMATRQLRFVPRVAVKHALRAA